MVKKVNGLYECEECGLTYKDQKTAKECEDYCRKYKSCSLEITERAVNKK